MDLKNIPKSKKTLAVINFVLLITLVFSLAINQIVIAKIYDALGIKKGIFKKIAASIIKPGSFSAALTGDVAQDAIKLAISQGIPEIYGEELGVSFDQVEPAMNIMKQFDPTYGKQKLVLTGDGLKRYIDVGLKISCEYCCGAKAIIGADGSGACGCAHSQAMRGLMAYLIQNHGSEYTNDEILRELARWKGMYFPKQMIQKLASQLQGADFTPDTAALVLGLNLPDYGQGSKTAPLPADLKSLPNMVGGC
ncbi:MAG: hypothetical protein A3J65_00350 [Candidatus Buchananbacteria bacterium RIFCSPHIGHO2_02_FULL_45_11b]|uniref:Uncharacterized protein n=4 Tax=Candidatus Buchananiibacteriota TaxID=1817903 RepID=A0A1G1Y4T1_9BACT|nr:MAG: hypothetical protein A2663_01045 [Candidatus Buchananbacteria bacterium RIFCSPHIGHO2_01_FULL_46_12]OGY50924.1 MAG: hypothetical protein A3J65_00350 [Candidatus Buchananbacteria bacterium RIFCSPHIGHO2_02_FULL_45_11b]OGY53592.1 MAG: hypothetical protein A3B15_03400 [Candidatus Buchananbacteria bacterium RIFCSPLOWO2_01_FULL_45_31]OGY57347.1 MAG: hypothetical protein A3H67_04380 [Candidatus Buchananbacteria bacterium RIFCSPLOWO2_02_FULL_46_11b]